MEDENHEIHTWRDTERKKILKMSREHTKDALYLLLSKLSLMIQSTPSNIPEARTIRTLPIIYELALGHCETRFESDKWPSVKSAHDERSQPHKDHHAAQTHHSLHITETLARSIQHTTKVLLNLRTMSPPRACLLPPRLIPCASAPRTAP